jgi:hypothetical protein
MSIQDRINSNLKQNIVPYEQELIEKGFEVYRNDFDKLKNILKYNDQVKYITKHQKDSDGNVVKKNILFRSGGFVNHVDNDYFSYLTTSKLEGIYQRISFSVQYDDLLVIYVKSKFLTNKTVSFKRPDDSKKFKSYINDTLVGSFKDNFAKNRFENTEKYLFAKETGNFIVD